MLTRADDKTLRALNSLRHVADWQTVREYLEANLHQVRRNMDISDGTQLHWLQGQAQALQSLLDKQDNALDVLKKHSK